MVRQGGERKVGDAVFGRRLQRDVLGEVAESIGLARRGCGSKETGHVEGVRDYAATYEKRWVCCLSKRKRMRVCGVGL